MENKTKWSKDVIVQLPIGAILPIKCNNARELNAAYQNACYVRRNHPRDDGGVYKISCSAKTMTVTVSVERKEDNESC
ncbi:MAG: hypothetical protein K2M69_08185 [Muribaculaceae bacterium]|nr:hypothetical protein [Muribaculaceae bacterium]